MVTSTHRVEDCLLRASAAVAWIIGIGVTLTVLAAAAWASVAAFLASALGSQSASVAMPPFLWPTIGAFLALGLAYLPTLVLLRRRPRVRGAALVLMGVLVLVGAIVAAFASWTNLQDLRAPILISAWLVWPGWTLVREGAHQLGRGDIAAR
jgi:hypothetical protein